MISRALAISILQCNRPGRSLRLNGQWIPSQVSDCLRGYWLERILAEVRAALPAHRRSYMDNCTHCEQWIDGGECIFPTLSIAPAVGDWQEGGGQILPFSTSKLDIFQAAGKKKSLSGLTVGLQGVKVDRVLWSRCFPKRQLEVSL